jgi:hypothetical protein
LICLKYLIITAHNSPKKSENTSHLEERHEKGKEVTPPGISSKNQSRIGVIILVKLKGSPVAVGFATNIDEIPPGMQEIDKAIKHCMTVSLARNEGRIFYSTAEKHEC